MKTRGRPSLGPTSVVSVRLPYALHDEVGREAVRRGVSVNAVIRERIRVRATDRSESTRKVLPR